MGLGCAETAAGKALAGADADMAGFVGMFPLYGRVMAVLMADLDGYRRPVW